MFVGCILLYFVSMSLKKTAGALLSFWPDLASGTTRIVLDALALRHRHTFGLVQTLPPTKKKQNEANKRTHQQRFSMCGGFAHEMQ